MGARPCAFHFIFARCACTGWRSSQFFSAGCAFSAREFVVFTVANNRATKHTVKIGAENPNQIQVIGDDLHDGEPVVTVGNYELEDGMAVEIKK